MTTVEPNLTAEQWAVSLASTFDKLISYAEPQAETATSDKDITESDFCIGIVFDSLNLLHVLAAAKEAKENGSQTDSVEMPLTVDRARLFAEKIVANLTHDLNKGALLAGDGVVRGEDLLRTAAWDGLL